MNSDDFGGKFMLVVILGIMTLVGLCIAITKQDENHKDAHICVDGKVYFKRYSEDFWRPDDERCLSTIKD
jgi:hypothetical protein